MLQLKPGVTLTNQQINGITNFVSKSVEGLSPDKVTIIDGNGKVLVAQMIIHLTVQVLNMLFK